MNSKTDSSICNLSGSWVLDKSQSSNLDEVLKLQGIGWLTRKAVSASTTTLKITQSADASAEWMVLEPALTGGLKGVPEKRELTWIEFEHNDTLFGSVSIGSHYIPGLRDPKGCVRPVVEFETKSAGIDGLAEAVLIDDQNQVEGELVEKAFIHDFIRSFDSGWTAEQIWAVEIIKEEKFLTRKVVVEKSGSTEYARIVYKRV